MIKLKQDKGITLVTLILSIVIMFIISSVIIYNANTGITTRALKDMYKDITIIKDKVDIYYAKYGVLPIIKTSYTNIENIKNINVNDNENYYVVDLEALENITLTYGKDYKDYKQTSDNNKTDIYVINEQSHTIYYVEGVTLDNINYYTIPNEYTKVEIPEVNRLTLKKLDKGVATIQIDASNKDIGIKTIKLYKGDTVYKTYEYTDQTKERKKEILDVVFASPEDSKWYIEVVDMNNNTTQSNEITINNDYHIKVPEPEGVKWDETKIDRYQDENGVVIPVPKGFTPILKEEGQGTARTGFVIRDTSDNIETQGNEFVWIPVEGMTYTYDRFNFQQLFGDYSNYSETLPVDEQRSINKYGGYYIGRYEAGITGGTLTSTSNSSITNTDEKQNWTGYTGGKLVIKKDQDVWNYITIARAKTEAEGLYNTTSTVVSKLCSSYGWDTALRFMQSTGSTYPTTVTGGNYSGDIKKTGTDIEHPCNIYDMGGNVWEWTTEYYNNTAWDAPCVRRGGDFNSAENSYPASYRSCSSAFGAIKHIGFRVALYIYVDMDS